jgi:hypothetical protein
MGILVVRGGSRFFAGKYDEVYEQAIAIKPAAPIAADYVGFFYIYSYRHTS